MDKEVQYIYQDKHEFFVSKPEGTIATLAVYRVNGVLWFSNLWVHHEHRRRGIAHTLLLKALAVYGKEDVYLQVWPYADVPLFSHELEEFYNKVGFRKTETPSIMFRPKSD